MNSKTGTLAPRKPSSNLKARLKGPHTTSSVQQAGSERGAYVPDLCVLPASPSFFSTSECSENHPQWAVSPYKAAAAAVRRRYLFSLSEVPLSLSRGSPEWVAGCVARFLLESCHATVFAVAGFFLVGDLG